MALAVYSALTAWMTWPLARDPARLGLPFADAYVNAWSLAWVARQAVRDPVHLFDSNAYYPHLRSLAYAESLLPQSLQAAAVILPGGPPLLAYNLVLLATFPLSGLGALLLARELGASRAGAFLAGLAYAFNTYRFDHMVHIQALSAQWFPFAILALKRSLERPAWRRLALLVVFSVAQGLSSGYYALLLGPALLVTLLFYGRAGRRGGSLGRVSAALALAAGLVFLGLLPQRLMQIEHGLSRGRGDALHWSARWSSYLDPGRYAALPHQRWLHERVSQREPLYPGLAVLGLGVAGLIAARRSAPARFAVLLALTGVLLSLGPEIRGGPLSLPGPFELLRLLPGASGVRETARMAVLGLLGLALLAALGWTWLAGRARVGLAATAAVALFMVGEAFPSGLRSQIRELPAPPPVTAWLAGAPRGAVLELPWNEFEEGALYLYWSTVHWQPMINGYGSYEPTGNRGLGLVGRRWPTPYSSRVLRASGVRYVVVHTDRVSPAQRERLLSAEPLPAGVKLGAVFGEDRLYVIDAMP